eukprot:scaffold2456_cov171-Skeletonema_dohrnii-CCMP3373.AAC.2
MISSYYPSPSPCGSLAFHSIINIHHRRQCCITTSPCGSLDDWRPWITLLVRLTAHSAVVVVVVVDVGDDVIVSCGGGVIIQPPPQLPPPQST